MLYAISIISRVWPRFYKNRRGSAAVEFALVAFPFFGLLFAIVETALIFYASQILESGTQDSGRLLYTHQAQDSAMTRDQFKQDLCNRVRVLFSCSNVSVDVRSYPPGTAVAIAPPNIAAECANCTYAPGAPGDTVVVRVFYKWPLFVTGFGYNLGNSDLNASHSFTKRLITATSAFRVEPL
jgi:Flp pilus assembly protein TadG